MARWVNLLMSAMSHRGSLGGSSMFLLSRMVIMVRMMKTTWNWATYKSSFKQLYLSVVQSCSLLSERYRTDWWSGDHIFQGVNSIRRSSGRKWVRFWQNQHSIWIPASKKSSGQKNVFIRYRPSFKAFHYNSDKAEVGSYTQTLPWA